jgi:hypothetical protein
MNVVSFFIALQIVLLFFMTFHDWIHIPPFIDITELEKHSTKKGRLINSTIFFFIVFIPLMLTWVYRSNLTPWILINICLFYVLLTVGTIFSWWVPYFFGSSEKHKADFAEYKNTHHFLPARADNVIPNTFHVILHLQIWTCFGISLYLLIRSFYN